jgi:hypothetical protein
MSLLVDGHQAGSVSMAASPSGCRERPTYPRRASSTRKPLTLATLVVG